MVNEVLGSITKILDTTSGDTGDTQTITEREQTLKAAQIQIEIGAGDTVVIEGKLESSLSFVTYKAIQTNDLFTIDLPPIYRARRTVDGGTEDSQVWLQKFGNNIEN